MCRWSLSASLQVPISNISIKVWPLQFYFIFFFLIFIAPWGPTPFTEVRKMWEQWTLCLWHEQSLAPQREPHSRWLRDYCSGSCWGRMDLSVGWHGGGWAVGAGLGEGWEARLDHRPLHRPFQQKQHSAVVFLCCTVGGMAAWLVCESPVQCSGLDQSGVM